MPKKFVQLITMGALLLLSGVASPRSFWRKINVNHPGQIDGVAMSPSGQHIVLNGDFGLYSSDGGVTWNPTSGFVPFILDYGDERHVFGVGTGQSGFVGVNRSSDYGRTWEPIELPQNLIDFREGDFIDSVCGWAVGDKDFIVTTNDGWQTWTTKSFGLPGFKGGGVSFLDTLQGFVSGALIGTDSAVLRTTDGGNGWEALPTGVYSLVGLSIDFVDSVNGWMVGATGSRRLYHTTNGAQSWTEQSPPGGFGFIEKVDAVDSLNAWVLTNVSNPRIWRTADAGRNWVLEYDSAGGSLLDFVMVSDTQGVAAGSYGNALIYGPAPLILGDLNCDQEHTPADVVLELLLVYLSQSAPAPDEAGDTNCDGELAPADVVLLLNRVYLLSSFPCSL